MDYDLYLVWVSGQVSSWGVFNSCDCPDPVALPDWMYRKYTVPREQEMKVFRKLMEVKDHFELNNVVPTKDAGRDIFPELSDLLGD